MKIINLNNKYNSKIYIKGNLIYKIDCQCKDFQFRRIKKIGKNVDIRYYEEPCKHLKPMVENLIKLGYKMKVPVEMEGSGKLTKNLKDSLLKRANYKCEKCGSDKDLQIHRIIRGYNGGKYNLKNCIVLCDKCHKKIHSGEFK